MSTVEMESKPVTKNPPAYKPPVVEVGEFVQYLSDDKASTVPRACMVVDVGERIISGIVYSRNSPFGKHKICIYHADDPEVQKRPVLKLENEGYGTWRHGPRRLRQDAVIAQMEEMLAYAASEDAPVVEPEVKPEPKKVRK